jgi:hypothetical protein
MQSLSKLKTRAQKIIGHKLDWQDAPHGWHSLAHLANGDIISLDPLKPPHIARVNGQTIPLDTAPELTTDVV